MNFRLIALLFLLSAHSHLGRTQYLSDPEILPAHPHMIYTNVTPAFNIAMGAWPSHPRFTLGYKWQTQSNRRYRASLHYIITDDYLDEDDGVGLLVDVTDSTLVQLFSTDKNGVAQLHAGMEWVKQRNVSSVFSADVIVQYAFEQYRQWNRTYARDTTCALCVDLANTDLSNNETTINEYTRHYLGVGFGFSAGYRFNWADHWELQLLFSPEWAILFPVSEVYGDPSFRNEPSQPYLDLNIRLVEAYFHYQF